MTRISRLLSLALLALVMSGCVSGDQFEGESFGDIAVNKAKKRGADITGYERAFELLGKASSGSGLSTSEVNELLAFASSKGEDVPARMLAVEALSSLGRNGFREQARDAIESLVDTQSPDVQAAIVRGLYATHSPQFEPYSTQLASSSTDYVAETAKAFLGMYKSQGFKE